MEIVERPVQHALGALLLGRENDVALFPVAAHDHAVLVELVDGQALAIGVIALRLRGFGFALGYALYQVGRADRQRPSRRCEIADAKMKRMRQFLTTLVVLWTAASIATYIYSQQQNIPSGIALAVLPAFLIEGAFYLMPGFEELRKLFDRMGPKPVRAALLTASAVLPYLAESLRTGGFRLSMFLALLGVTLAASFWYAFLRPSIPADLLFLALIAAVYLSRLFDQIYGQPAPHVQLAILGKLMWIRLGIMAVFSLRTIENPRFGFVPSGSEWRIGFLYYVVFLPVAAVLAYMLGFARFHMPALEWWKLALLIPGTFLGFLWVVALCPKNSFFGRSCSGCWRARWVEKPSG